MTPDKYIHIAAGAFMGYAFKTLGLDKGVALCLVCSVACAKEAYDWYCNYKASKAGLPKTHGVEADDIIATFIGGFMSLYP